MLLHSAEGVTQGDALSMILYGLALQPLARDLRSRFPTLLQLWYADDCCLFGPPTMIADALAFLTDRGSHVGYFPEPRKSVAIIPPNSPPPVCLSDMGFSFTDGARYLGGFVGSPQRKQEWVQPQVEQWGQNIKVLASIAKTHPQDAFIGLSKSLQSEWKYLQRTTAIDPQWLLPLEEALRDNFIPALLGEADATAVPNAISLLSKLSTTAGGLGVPDPMRTSAHCHEQSKVGTSLLVRSLLYSEAFDVPRHTTQMEQAREAYRKAWGTVETNSFDCIRRTATVRESRRLHRNRFNGAWLHLLPSEANCTILTALEYRDSVRLRMGMQPQHLEPYCDGCGKQFSVEHAMNCKKGGLVGLRHNDLKRAWMDLLATALEPAAVRDEPLIRLSHDGSRQSDDAKNPYALRGDIAATGLWKRQQTCILDVRVTDPDSHYQRKQPLAKLLARHESEKQSKYVDECKKHRRSFTPLVYTTDGVPGIEARRLTKQVAELLAVKWDQPYSVVCGYVRSRIALALIRSLSMCLRCSRVTPSRAHRPTWELEPGGAGLSLYE